MTLSAHRQMVNTGLTLLWPIAFAMNVKITLSQLRLHVKNCGSRCIICDKFNEQEKRV